MSLMALYYQVRPLIPRSLQVKLRGVMVQRKRKRFSSVWPIDPQAGKSPKAWTGWPANKKFALVLTHDVDTAEGQRNCRRLIGLEKTLGFRSSFGFVPERYDVSVELRHELENNGFEVVVHGLYHDGRYYDSQSIFRNRACKINHYLKQWEAVGFRSPSMLRNLNWFHYLNIEYDSSTFDTDPFEPQPDGVKTVFPFYVGGEGGGGYVELPYTLPQDFTLFILMGEKDITIWKEKLDWIARRNGMALLISHPDYMNFDQSRSAKGKYPIAFYEDFLQYVRTEYSGQYWNVRPREIARFWAENCVPKDQLPQNRKEGKLRKENNIARFQGKKLWIDLDNSPHVPFFSPIINKVEEIGCQVLITARDCSQTCDLADLFRLKYERIGRHYGKRKVLKVAGTVLRALQLMKEMKKPRPDLAISHGSRAQMLAAWMLKIPSIVIMDYEYVKGFLKPTWIMMPEVISSNAISHSKDRILHYPGIKEDVYVATFRPDPAIKRELGIGNDELIATIRPPATEAHYHNSESEALFSSIVNLLGSVQNARLIILPRNEIQEAAIRKEWIDLCATGKIILPSHVVDGLNLLWYSDLVISGGGTMNREAAALGLPVYSIFRGKIGAVDQFLVKSGRLTLLENMDDIRKKLVLAKRKPLPGIQKGNGKALNFIVEGIIKVLETPTREMRSTG